MLVGIFTVGGSPPRATPIGDVVEALAVFEVSFVQYRPTVPVMDDGHVCINVVNRFLKALGYNSVK